MFLMTLGAMRKLLILFTLTNGTYTYKRLMPNFFVPNWSQQINSISEYVQQLVNNDDYIESDTGEREEWMIIADMKLQSDNGNKLRLNCPSDFYAQDRLKYTAQEIGDMPHWINMQKKRRQLEKGNSNAG